jgi:L-2-hydroxyglutarate oxidase LhgO
VVHAALAVNCAGNYGDVLSSILGLLPTFTITPRKGQFVVFQPATLHRLRHVVLPLPTDRTKGVLLFPTLSGHIVCGPTAEDVVRVCAVRLASHVRTERPRVAACARRGRHEGTRRQGRGAHA